MSDRADFRSTTPATTLVILLGASEFPRSNLTSIPACRTSARDIKKYFLAADGYALPASNMLDRIDSPRQPSKILDDIADFLISRQGVKQQPKTSDLILFYTGHGGFTENREYFLALSNTRQGFEGATSMRMSDLAFTIRKSAPGVRRFLILDCCYAAASFSQFQSAPLSAARVQIMDALPKEGTTLLCSSNARSVSIAPPGSKHTMFSGALIEVLREGAATMGDALSMEQVGALINERIRDRYADEAVRPEVLSPDQRLDDIAKVPIFPNPAAARKRTESQSTPEGGTVEDLLTATSSSNVRNREQQAVFPTKREPDASRVRIVRKMIQRGLGFPNVPARRLEELALETGVAKSELKKVLLLMAEKGEIEFGQKPRDTSKQVGLTVRRPFGRPKPLTELLRIFFRKYGREDGMVYGFNAPRIKYAYDWLQDEYQTRDREMKPLTVEYEAEEILEECDRMAKKGELRKSNNKFWPV